MDPGKPHSRSHLRRAASGPADGVKACPLTLNKLTLATLVVAVVSFAGTAFAAVPPECAAQAPVEASSASR